MQLLKSASIYKEPTDQVSKPFFLSRDPLPILKTYGGTSKSFYSYGLYVSIFTVLKIRMDAFAAATTSHNYLMEF